MLTESMPANSPLSAEADALVPRCRADRVPTCKTERCVRTGPRAGVFGPDGRIDVERCVWTCLPELEIRTLMAQTEENDEQT